MPLLPSALPPKGEARRYVANDFLNLIALPHREAKIFHHFSLSPEVNKSLYEWLELYLGNRCHYIKLRGAFAFARRPIIPHSSFRIFHFLLLRYEVIL